jgi:hypothetical protein
MGRDEVKFALCGKNYAAPRVYLTNDFSGPCGADSVVNGAKHVVGTQHGNQPGSRRAALCALGLQARDRDVDLMLTQFKNGFLEDPGSGEVNIDHAIRLNHDKAAWVGCCSDRFHQFAADVSGV